MNRSLAVLPVLLALAACGTEPAEEAPDSDRRGAEGEVLGGSISDAMLPLPTVRSQSPPLESDPVSRDSSTGPAEAPAGRSAPTPEADAEAEATAEPAEE